MAKFSEIKKEHYDFVVVGSQLTATLVAFVLERKFHKKVAMLEASEVLGQEDAVLTVKGQQIPSGPHLVPNFPEANDLISWLNNISASELFSEPFDCQALSVESGHLTPFVGFGERKFKSLSHLAGLNLTEVLSLLQDPSHLVEHLQNLFLGDMFSLSNVTSITLAGGEQKVANINVNGAKDMTADQFIFCVPPKSFAKLFELTDLNNKFLNKVPKQKTFAQVRLNYKLSHNPYESPQRFVVFGNKDDFEPCAGQVWSLGEDHFCSWTCLTPAELAEDHEHLGAVLRHMKKQIKRVNPLLIENLEFEKILVETDIVGDFDWQGHPFGKIQPLKNLWLSHQQMVSLNGFWGSTFAAHQTLNALIQELSLTAEPEPTLIANENETRDFSVTP